MSQKEHKRFANKVQSKASRKLKAQTHTQRSVWLGLSTMGIVGWSVAVPTLLCLLLGLWLDRHYQMTFSWTLNLLIIGVLVGCVGAWHWVSTEAKAIHKEEQDD